MPSDALVEEFEVLESIYPTELSKISDHEIRIEAEPDDPTDAEKISVRLALGVTYPDDYPDAIPALSLDVVEGDMQVSELERLLEELRKLGEENLGMAMTFTLVSHLREKLSQHIRDKAAEQRRLQMEKERRESEAEYARTRGTPVTVETFKAWKIKFDQELALKKVQEEEEKLRAMTPKEKDEYKRSTMRLTGRQLFERNKGLDEESLLEDGTVSVDISQYERTKIEEEPEEEGVTFSDSE